MLAVTSHNQNKNKNKANAKHKQPQTAPQEVVHCKPKTTTHKQIKQLDFVNAFIFVYA
jgi:hypothetical protein